MKASVRAKLRADRDRGFLEQIEGQAVIWLWAELPADSRWPPLRPARLRCERESVVSFALSCSADSNQNERSSRRGSLCWMFTRVFVTASSCSAPRSHRQPTADWKAPGPANRRRHDTWARTFKAAKRQATRQVPAQRLLLARRSRRPTRTVARSHAKRSEDLTFHQ
jgi:hypothetical protein